MNFYLSWPVLHKQNMNCSGRKRESFRIQNHCRVHWQCQWLIHGSFIQIDCFWIPTSESGFNGSSSSSNSSSRRFIVEGIPASFVKLNLYFELRKFQPLLTAIVSLQNHHELQSQRKRIRLLHFFLLPSEKLFCQSCEFLLWCWKECPVVNLQLVNHMVLRNERGEKNKIPLTQRKDRAPPPAGPGPPLPALGSPTTMTMTTTTTRTWLHQAVPEKPADSC